MQRFKKKREPVWMGLPWELLETRYVEAYAVEVTIVRVG
jgi:hypothetical protein